MERNREGRRSSLAPPPPLPRRPRLSGPKDASDEDERMDDAPEARPWERPKKERISSFHVSMSANPRNKRKRQGLQEAQAQGRNSVCDDADESTEEAEIAVSEDDDEPPPTPVHRRPGKSRGNGKVKEDEIVMEIPTVPRKARSAMSSSSRFTSILRRPQESLPADAPRPQTSVAPQTLLNGISSPNILGKPGRRLKSTGTKIRPIKAPKVPEPSTISDQEVEVAEALFVLARSMPSHAGVSESKLEQKTETKLETEVNRSASPPQVPVPSPSPVSLPSSSGPGPSSLPTPATAVSGSTPLQFQVATAEAPKRKRPRAIPRQEEGRPATPIQMGATGVGAYSTSPSGVMHSPVEEVDQANLSQKSLLVVDETLGQPEPSKGKVAMDSPLSVPQVHAIEDVKMSGVEHHSTGQIKATNFEEETQNNVDNAAWKFGCPGSMVSSPTNVKVETSADITVKNDGSGKLELLSRPSESIHDNDGDTSKLNIDLMVPALKVSLKEEDVLDMPDDSHSLQEDASINSTSHPAQAPHVRLDQSSKVHKDMVEADMGYKKEEAVEERRKIKVAVDGATHEQKQEFDEHTSGQLQKEQIPYQIQRGPIEGRKETERESARITGPGRTKKADTGTPSASSFLPSTLSTSVSSSPPVALAGWMGGLPTLGYYGSAAPPWPAGASLPGSSIDGKAAHLSVQPPHAAVLPPVPRMKRCATHVYIAHCIYLEQRARHSLWPASFCRGAPYNLNIPPVGMLDKEKIGGTYVDLTRKASTQQPGPAYGYTVSQSNGPGMTGNNGTLCSSATGKTLSALSNTTVGVSAEAGVGTASGSVVNMAAPYLQVMQQNGYASFSFPFNGPPGQAAQFFNGPFFPALVPPLPPHLQALAQQAPNVLPAQKQQQGLLSMPQSSSSQLLAQPQQQQQQLQLQLAPQSPSNSQQQQHHMGTSTQHFGGHSDKDSNTAGESQSTAESRLSAMQRSMCGQARSNLPNLNISPLSLPVTPNVPAFPAHLMATLGGKQTSKSQQQTHFQGQQSASLLPSIQPQQQQQLMPQNSGSGSRLQMKGLDSSQSQGYSPITMSNVNRSSVGPGPLGLVSVASVMATQGHAVLPGTSESARTSAQQQQGFGGHNQQFHQRSMPRTSASINDDTFAPNTHKGRDFVEERKSSVKQGGVPSINFPRVDIEVSSPSVQGSPTSGGGALTARVANNVGRTINPATATGARNPKPPSSAGSGQGSPLQNQSLKQTMARSKAMSGSNVQPAATPPTVPAYMERVPLPGNFGKASGTVAPFPGQMAPCSQGLKQGQAGPVKAGQRTSQQGLGIPTSSGVPPQAVLTSAMAKSQGQQARTNNQGTSSIGTPPRMPSSVSVPVLPSATLSLSSSHPSSVPKALGAPVPKSPANGKGAAPVTKSGPAPVKKSAVSGPAMSSVMSPGQNMSAKGQLQQKTQGQLPPPQFSQQSTIPVQQQQLGTKHPIYHPQQTQQPQQGSQYKQSAQPQYRPQPFLQQQQQQQYLHQSSLQQQALPQHTQQPHYFQQNPHNSQSQQGHTAQQLRHDQHHPQLQSVSSSSTSTTNNGFSLTTPNLTLGTGIVGSNTSSDGADQFQVSGSKVHPPKASLSPGNLAPGGGIPENNMTLHPSTAAVSVQQVSSQHTGTSHFLQLAPVLGAKSIDQKTLPEGSNREEMSSIRHMPASSSSQPPLVTNPTSS